MSLVEKALVKLQTAGRHAEHSVAEPAVVKTGTVAPKPTQSLEPLTASATVALEVKLLQESGMLPAESVAGGIGRNSEFRRLKWALLDAIQERRAKSVEFAGAVMVTSSIPGEGKTFTSFNLALSLAREQGARVILVDGDIAKGHISNLLRLQDRSGMIDYLADRTVALSDVLVKTDHHNLYVLPAGKFRPQAAELLAGPRMAGLLAELTSHHPSDVVIFDSSPMLLTNSAHVLARLLPQIIFVVHAGKTPQSVVLEALEALDRSKVSVVLNQSEESKASDSYHHDYGYYGND